MQAVIKRFEAEHDDTEVDVVEVPQNQLDTKLRTAARGGGVPDLVFTFRGYPFDWASSGLIQPVDDTLAAIGKERYDNGVLEPGVFRGKTHFVPVMKLQQVLYYRADWFTAAGLTAPETWAEVLIAAKKLHNPPSRYGFLAYNKPPEEIFVADLMAVHDSDLLGPDGEVAIDSPQTVATLKLARQLATYSPPGSMTKNQTDQRLSFSNGLGAMLMASTSTLGAVAEAELTDKVKVVPVPVAAGDDQAPVDVYGFAVPKAASNVAGANAFLELLLKQDVYDTFAANMVTGFLPVITSTVRDDKAYWKAPAVAPFAESIRVALTASRDGILPGQRHGPTKHYSKIRASGVLNKMVDEVVVSGTPPHVAAANAAKTVRQIVGS